MSVRLIHATVHMCTKRCHFTLFIYVHDRLCNLRNRGELCSFNLHNYFFYFIYIFIESYKSTLKRIKCVFISVSINAGCNCIPTSYIWWNIVSIHYGRISEILKNVVNFNMC